MRSLKIKRVIIHNVVITQTEFLENLGTVIIIDYWRLF